LAYTSSCSIDQKHPAAPQNGPNHNPSRLSTGVLIRLILSPEIEVSTSKDLLIPRGRAGSEASYLSPEIEVSTGKDLLIPRGRAGSEED